MRCVCGCDRTVPKNQGEQNLLAASVALELLAWDKNRSIPGAEIEGREGLIARGAEHYQRLLYSLHQGVGEPDEDGQAWLKEARRMRADRGDMTKKQFFGGGSGPKLDQEDIDRLDPLHPELSFTGGVGAPLDDERIPAAVPAAREDDGMVEKLERLGALHRDGVLTDEEFAGAKARLIDG